MATVAACCDAGLDLDEARGKPMTMTWRRDMSVELLGAIITGAATLVTALGIMIGRLWGTWSDHVTAMRDIHGRLKDMATDADRRADAEEIRRKEAERQRQEAVNRLTEVLDRQRGLEKELEAVKERLDKLLISHDALEAQHKADLKRLSEVEELAAEQAEGLEEYEGIADGLRIDRDLAKEELARVIELYELATGAPVPDRKKGPTS